MFPEYVKQAQSQTGVKTMKKNKPEGWKKIIDQFPKIRILSYEWLRHKPSPEDFNLEEYNINNLYKSKKKFEEEKKEKIRMLRKEIPKSTTRGTFSWEGYVAIIFMMGMVAYQFFSKNPTFLMFGFLAIGSLFFFFLYYYRLRKKQIALKKKLADINARQRKIETERFRYEDAYESLLDYAKALSDYNAWERRGNPAEWKKMDVHSMQDEIISMLRTYGYDAYTAERRDISIIYEKTPDEKKAIYCCTGKEMTDEDAQAFIRALKRNDLEGAFAISLYGFSKEAVLTLKGNEIKLKDIKDLIAFEKKIEDKDPA